MNRTVDLRSDTVTQPPPGMRKAIAEAMVGDDVYGEDPTVNALEGAIADRLGKEAAVLVPSGTMANLLALLAHCPRGQKALVGDRSDIWLWEAGGASVLGGLVLDPLPTGAAGELALDDLDAAYHDLEDPQRAVPGVLCLETTHCLCGGVPLDLDYLARVAELGRRRGTPVHLDGARIFNAALAQGVDVRDIAAHADSVALCLSKGLAAPVGSLVAGSGDLVSRVRRLRKMVGGGMRQAGILAAAGLFALDEMVGRLAEDHDNARRLARGLARLPGVEVDTETPATNIVFFRLAAADRGVQEFLDALAARGVLLAELGRGRIRAVTHYGIEPRDVDRAVSAVREVMAPEVTPTTAGERRPDWT
jgi:threonine aldolase